MTVLLVGILLAVGWGLWLVRPVLAPFILALVLAYLIAPLVNGVTRWGLGRGWAILLVYAVLGLMLGLGVVKLLPKVIGEARRLSEAVPGYGLQARLFIAGMQQRIREMGLHPGLRDMFDRLIVDLELRSVRTLELLIDVRTIQQAAGFFASLLLAPFLAFYMLKDMDRFKARFVRSIPLRYRQESIALLRSLDRVLSGFVRGEILLSLAVGGLAALATTMLGLRYALLLGIWAFFTEFIPYIGPVLGAIPAVLMGFGVSPWKALEVVLAFAIIQQIENAVLSPKIMGESVGLHPLFVIFAVLAGGYLAGGWGLILALPVAGLLRVLWIFVVARLTEITPQMLALPAARPEGGQAPDLSKDE